MVLKLLDLVPSWAWAAMVVAFAVTAGVLGYELQSERVRSARLEATLERERGQANRDLAVATNRVLAAERVLRASRAEQERKDGDAQATIADLGERVRRAGADGRLRDRFAAPCHPADPGPRTATADRGEDPAEAGRALSPEFSGAVIAILRDADDINAAYASCRADAVGLRQQLRQLSPPPGSASAGSP